MPNKPDTLPAPQPPLIECPQCGHYCHPHDIHCPECNSPLISLGPTTHKVKRPHSLETGESKAIDVFAVDAVAILTVLSGEGTLTTDVDKPIVLGRRLLANDERLLDLSPFNAFQQGVSRRHCRLQRRGYRLIITDLGSSNGTYLNNERLLPFKDYIIAHGDHLVLGTFQINITFSIFTTD